MHDTLDIVRTAPVIRSFSRPYWEATREYRIVLQYCLDSGRFQWHPRPTSRYTGRRNLEWREVEGRGAIYAYTVTRVAPGELHGHTPFILAAVQLDDDVLIEGILVGCALDAVKNGMRVKPAWGDMSDGTHLLMFQSDED